MESRKEYYELTCTWQSGETVYDRTDKQFEADGIAEVKHLLRTIMYHKRDFKFWVRRITVYREDIMDDIVLE